jgi:hypothetical protein
LAAIKKLFPEPSEVHETDLHDLSGHATPPSLDTMPIQVSLDTLRTCIAAAAPLSSPHKDGWRVEHMAPLAVDQARGEALAAFMMTVRRGEVSMKVANLLSSATLAILLKNDADTMAAMKEALGENYL